MNMNKDKILEKANRRFAGKWMAAEDNSYIFPIDSVVFSREPGPDLPDDIAKLPLAIRVTKFVNDIDVPLSIGSIVETGQNTVFHDNPYDIDEDSVIRFITKSEAKRFIARIRKHLTQEVNRLDKLGI